MGVIIDEQELSCSVTPKRFFKAFFLSNELMPKIVPVFKSIEFEEGNGAPGSIKKISYFDQGGEVKSMKHRVEEVDEANLVYKFTFIEGGNIGTDFEVVTSVNKVVEGGADGGCIFRATTTYITKGDNHSVIQESIKKAKDGLTAYFQAAVAHLHSNPHEYN